jgi:hypothetical protein
MGIIKYLIITGQRFGRLTVIEESERGIRKNGKTFRSVKVMCDCGNIVMKNFSSVVNGKTMSCGCFKKELDNSLNERYRLKHKLTKHPLYRRWQDMKKRCSINNIYYKNYYRYAGRGISVCAEWEHSFENFYKWAIEAGFKKNLIIDRIDVDGNYEPNNCRWVDKLHSDCNTSRTVWVTFKGEKKSLFLLCIEMGLNYKRTLYQVKKKKLSLDEIVKKLNQ